MTTRSALSFVACLILAGIAARCSQRPPAGTGTGFRPIDPDAAVFWDRQTTESAELLRGIISEFNTAHRGLPIKVEKAGGYGDIFRKVSASIQAGALPAMAVSYESMTTEYVAAGAVAALDPFIEDPELGISAEELDDYFPVTLETNRYAAWGGRTYSFPFAKSVLMLYFNRRVLDAAGIAGPPQTWDEFLDQCRKVKASTGKHAYALSVDCSTISGMIFSMGGSILNEEGQCAYDAEASVRVFELLETLAKEDLAYQITPGTFDDELALAGDQVAFTLRTSGGRANVALAMQGDFSRWGMTRLPQAAIARPATVLFGPNITLFNTSREQQEAAWAFVKYFTTPEVSVRWALGTGYLPVRKSALKHPEVVAYLEEWEYNKEPFTCLEFARPEPNVSGWQQVRTLVEQAETEVLSGLKTGRQAALDLKQKADEVLARNRRDTAL